jgi:hypothetical protein
LNTRALNGRACLRLCLHYFASGSLYSTLALFAEISLATLSHYINWCLLIINKILRNISETSLTLTNVDYLTKVSDKIINLHSAYMKGCAFILNKSLHQLKLDKITQNNFYNLVPHPNFYEWKEKQCKKGLYVFLF